MLVQGPLAQLGERHNGIVEVSGSIPLRSTPKDNLHGCPFFIRQTMIATKIQLLADGTVSLLWDDAHDSRISLQTLRDNCPCAGCKGETVLMHTYEPVKSPALPGKYTLRNIEQVGYYALQMYWGDGHATGIYTWDHLRNLCECELCAPTRSLR